MKIFRGLQSTVQPPTHAVVTIGMFDGLHRAHQKIIRTVVRLARNSHGTSLVVTFDPDPLSILDPKRAQPILMPLFVRLHYLKLWGVDQLVVIPFTQRFAQMKAETFIQDILIKRFHTHILVVGDAFQFGRGRRGSMRLLERLGPRYDMRIVPVPAIKRSGAVVSSSRIRRLIQEGKLSKARMLLGRNPTLYGTVVRGAGRGHRLGIPTANVKLSSQVIPPQGVYAVYVCPETWHHARAQIDSPHCWGGVMNLGTRPTFGSGPLVCEAHLFGFSGRLYGRNVSVSLLARLRSEKCFESPRALIRQVHRDMTRARRFFNPD